MKKETGRRDGVRHQSILLIIARFFLIPLLLAAPLDAHAQTFVLRDGQTLDAEVERENADFYVLRLPNGSTKVLLKSKIGSSGAAPGSQDRKAALANRRPERLSAFAELWPPEVGKPYPDLELYDQTGKITQLSSFKGSVILVEPVAMNCTACQAFSGAHRLGAYADVSPQQDLKSIEEYFPKYTGGMSFSDRRFVFIQIILFDLNNNVPTAQDARKWAEQFRLDRAKNRVVLASRREMAGPASYNMIPGFQLIDKNFILRSDSTGHNPKHDLWKHLLPMVPKLLKE